jgi:hypothetical protein
LQDIARRLWRISPKISLFPANGGQSAGARA